MDDSRAARTATSRSAAVRACRTTAAGTARSTWPASTTTAPTIVRGLGVDGGALRREELLPLPRRSGHREASPLAVWSPRRCATGSSTPRSVEPARMTGRRRRGSRRRVRGPDHDRHRSRASRGSARQAQAGAGRAVPLRLPPRFPVSTTAAPTSTSSSRRWTSCGWRAAWGSRRPSSSTDTPCSRSPRTCSFPWCMLKHGGRRRRSKCRFVGEEGCTVYEDRPWACRMYPVGMAIPPARAGVEPEPIYFLFEDDFCKGHGEDADWTVDRVARRPGRRRARRAGGRASGSSSPIRGSSAGRKLDPRRMEMFHMACYDLDKFRSFVFESTFLERFELEPELVEQIRDGRRGAAALRLPLAALRPVRRTDHDGARGRTVARRGKHDRDEIVARARRRGGYRRRDRRPRGRRGRARGAARGERARRSAGASCGATTTSRSSARRPAAWSSTRGAWSETRDPRADRHARRPAAETVDGHWKVKLRSAPAYVNDRCTACGACSEVCPAKVRRSDEPGHERGAGDPPALPQRLAAALHRSIARPAPTAARPASRPASTTRSTSTPRRPRRRSRSARWSWPPAGSPTRWRSSPSSAAACSRT